MLNIHFQYQPTVLISRLMPTKQSILEYSKDDLITQCEQLGLKKFVVSQIIDWLYQKNVTEFDQMTNISKKNQQLLQKSFHVLPYQNIQILPSKDGFATKYIIQLFDGKTIECVVLKEKDYDTLCLSSQAGCPMDCKFCVTGIAGLERNLSVSEIVGQLLLTKSHGHRINHIVFMGMGEPLLNEKKLLDALIRFEEVPYFNLSKRNITVSTVGYLPGIQNLIKDEKFLNLAFSVGHPNPLLRHKVMPVEQRFSIIDVVTTLKQYQQMHNRKLTLEYTLLKGYNDQLKTIDELVNMSHYLDAKINLINLNPHRQIPYEPISSSSLTDIKKYIQKKGARVTIRFRKGQDIGAACGQLGDSILNKISQND